MSFDAILRALPPGSSVQAAGRLAHGGSDPRSVAVRLGSQRLRCASLLKPLYAWTAERGDGWATAAQPAVVDSCNDHTRTLWLGTGPRVVLGRIADRTGVRWTPPVEERFGSVEVTADEVVTAYCALAAAGWFGDRDAQAIVTWMAEAGQDFGVRALFPGQIAVKCGWYGGADETWLRTHAVTVDRLPDGTSRVICVLTALPYLGERERAEYRAALDGGGSVDGEHERICGEVVRALVRATIAELGG
ncbi:hypothetical protein [Nonomuraea soli]|uniref:Uncharacterized protein n=1 Tax=Nonomuraea soli TaxID=1032476 RepID=A0A7W0HRX8_9ACTN|nr:hypothetical protein [Nonomuraea soli]MBA2893468.1 hypothetical protein [Nonomuraea soli]